MTYLQLCQSLATECGLSAGSSFAGTLSTVNGQIGSLQRVVGWIAAAWNDIQTERTDWEFMRSSNLQGGGVSFVPTAGQAFIPFGVGAGTVGLLFDNFGAWVPDSIRSYTTAVGTNDEIEMSQISYESWRDGYMLGALRSVRSRPFVVAVAPDKSLCIGPPSNGLYTVTADYFMSPAILAADTDVPRGLPVRYHMMIVYAAMRKYGLYESAPEVFQRGDLEYKRLRGPFLTQYLPSIAFSGALV